MAYIFDTQGLYCLVPWGNWEERIYIASSSSSWDLLDGDSWGERNKERRKTKKREWRSSRSGLACCDCIYTSSVLDWTWVVVVKSEADESRSIETPKEVEMSFYFQKPGFKVSFEYIWIARGWLELSAELVILPSTSSEALTKPSQRPSKISCCRECVNVRYRHLYPHTRTAGSQFGVFTHNLENTKKERKRSTYLASSPHQTRSRKEFLPLLTTDISFWELMSHSCALSALVFSAKYYFGTRYLFFWQLKEWERQLNIPACFCFCFVLFFSHKNLVS